MRITVKLFAILRDQAGASEAAVDLPAGATVAAAAAEIARRFPPLAAAIPKIAFAVNQEYAPSSRPLRDGDELAMIPAVSGGTDGAQNSPTDWLGLCADALPVAEATAFIADPAAGGLAVFLGTTRAQSGAAGQSLLALDYQAYAEMAEKQLADLARRVRQRWPVVKLVILHRTGRVPVAQASVLVAVSTPHRNEAFDACRWLIDSLKHEATIWKKEIWSDGAATWVEPRPPE
jgi:molybdopterin synthase catalytic subunit